MRALVNRGDGTAAVDVAQIPDPVPASHEAVIAIAAMAINRGELRLLAMRDHGWRPGQDVAGTVVRPAVDGSGPDAGTRVVAWPEQAGWAEQVAVPTSHLAILDESVSFPAASTLPIAGMTALRALRLGGDLQGRKVLVTGAAGGVGRFAVEIAAGWGADVTAVASGAERAQGLTDLGASTVVDDIAHAGNDFDLILESVGGGSLERAVSQIGPGGTVVVFGNSSNEPSSISFADFRGRPGARIEAFFVYESGSQPSFGDDLQLLADMVAGGRLHPEVGLELGWTDANEALRALGAREVNGKAVLVVD